MRLQNFIKTFFSINNCKYNIINCIFTDMDYQCAIYYGNWNWCFIAFFGYCFTTNVYHCIKMYLKMISATPAIKKIKCFLIMVIAFSFITIKRNILKLVIVTVVINRCECSFVLYAFYLCLVDASFGLH